MLINRNIIANNPDKELLIEIINPNFKQNELIDFWNSINKNIIIKEDKKEWPDYIFFCKDKYITKDNPEGIIMYYNKKSEWFIIDYDKIWSIFKSRFNLNLQSINKFVASMVFKTYKLNIVTIGYVGLMAWRGVFKTYKLNIVTMNHPMTNCINKMFKTYKLNVIKIYI